eukprot:7382677-Prymnesium_polylepis.4
MAGIARHNEGRQIARRTAKRTSMPLCHRSTNMVVQVADRAALHAAAGLATNLEGVVDVAATANALRQSLMSERRGCCRRPSTSETLRALLDLHRWSQTRH